MRRYLTAILARLATREIPSPYRFEEDELRVIAIGQTFRAWWLKLSIRSAPAPRATLR